MTERGAGLGTRVRFILVGLIATLTVAVGLPGQGGAFTNGFPDSMAAIGDSITQAANADGNNIGASHPEHSWSTGYDSGDVILSHYERIRGVNGAIAGRNFNDAVSGARMDDAPGQAQNAVNQGVEYVTFLMGGNDVCTSSKTNMTPVATYESYFRQAMNILTTGLPNAKIYVLSVPDVYQLWKLYHTDWYPRWVWRTFDVCQSMLDESNTEADRQFVRQRNIDFNTVLRNVCAQYTQCLYDNDGVFNYQFTRADVSKVDYFHPSITGQKNLAEKSWRGGYWPTV
jgi:lysophospholipase L1-like esterase